MTKALKYFEFCLDSIIIYGIKVKVKILILRRRLVTLYIRLTNLSPMVLSFYPLPPPLSSSLSLSLSLHRCSVLRYSKLLKAIRKGKKSKQGFDVTPGNLYGNLPHSSEGRALTCCDEGSNSYYSLILY